MTPQCSRCGTDIDTEDVRYEQHATDASTDTYCSVNCIVGVEHVDEDRARDRIFADQLEA
jgi:hypothetical protein